MMGNRCATAVMALDTRTRAPFALIQFRKALFHSDARRRPDEIQFRTEILSDHALVAFFSRHSVTPFR